MDKIFSTGEAAKELGVSRDALTWALRRGAPECGTRLAGRRAFSSKDIEVLREWFTKRGHRA